MSVLELEYLTATGKTAKKYRVRVKSGGQVVADRMFYKKGEAELWEAEQKRRLYLGEFVSPKAGRELLGSAIDRWRVQREGTVASKTYNTEGYALKHLTSLRKRPVSAVSAADLNALYAAMLKSLSRDTVVRFRQIVSAFYSWAVSEKLVAKNPVLDSKVPAGTAQRTRKEIFPFTYAELVAVHTVLVANTSKTLADIVLVLGLTGIRWGELAALRVRDVQELPYPALRVVRSKPDGQPVRNVTKGGKSRTVPLTDDAAAIILPLVAGRMPDHLLFPSAAGGHRANNNFKRDAHWKEYGRGRRIHDLRHSAATIWLSDGVDLKTVQTWLGHSTAKLTADTYAHHMGTDADVAAVDRLNRLRAAKLRSAVTRDLYARGE